MVQCGKETLALYILQDIVLFKVVKNMVIIISKSLGYNPLNTNECILGYVIAPLLSLVLMLILMKIINSIKSFRYTKYVFGGKFL